MTVDETSVDEMPVGEMPVGEMSFGEKPWLTNGATNLQKISIGMASRRFRWFFNFGFAVVSFPIGFSILAALANTLKQQKSTDNPP